MSTLIVTASRCPHLAAAAGWAGQVPNRPLCYSSTALRRSRRKVGPYRPDVLDALASAGLLRFRGCPGRGGVQRRISTVVGRLGDTVGCSISQPTRHRLISIPLTAPLRLPVFAAVALGAAVGVPSHPESNVFG